MSGGYADDDGVTLWEYSATFRKLVYVAVALFCVIGYGFRVSYTVQKQQAHLDYIRQQQQAAQQAHQAQQNTANQANTPQQRPASMINSRMLDSFPSASQRVGERLNPDNLVPASGFDMYFFNTQDPYTVVHKENVANIALKFSSMNFHNIPTDFFGAYWVGTVFVPVEGEYFIKASASHASIRAIIDGRVIGKDEQHGTIGNRVYLQKGVYTLEIEYKNATPNTNMHVFFGQHSQIYKKEALANIIAGMGIDSSTPLQVVAIPSAKNPKKTIAVHSSIAEPYVLMLFASAGTLWQVHGIPPKAIIYNADNQVQSVGTPYLIRSNFYLSGNDLSDEVYCACTEGGFYCPDYKDLGETVAMFKEWTGLNLAGGKSDSDADVIFLPDVVVTKNMVDRQRQNHANQQQSCATTKTIAPVMPTTPSPANMSMDNITPIYVEH